MIERFVKISRFGQKISKKWHFLAKCSHFWPKNFVKGGPGGGGVYAKHPPPPSHPHPWDHVWTRFIYPPSLKWEKTVRLKNILYYYFLMVKASEIPEEVSAHHWLTSGLWECKVVIKWVKGWFCFVKLG